MQTLREIQDNLVFLRLKPSDGKPTQRQLIALSLGLMFVGLAVEGAALLADEALSFEGWVPRVFLVLGAGSILLSPLIATLSLLVTARTDMQGQAFQLQRISTLSRQVIVNGYLGAALYRLRIFWAILAALLLPFVLSIAHYFSTLDIGYTCSGRLGCAASLADTLPFTLLLALLLVGITLLVFAALNWLALCLSAWAVFYVRQISLAALLAFGLVCATMLGLAGIYLVTKPAFPLIVSAMALGSFHFSDEIRFQAARRI